MKQVSHVFSFFILHFRRDRRRKGRCVLSESRNKLQDTKRPPEYLVAFFVLGDALPGWANL